MSITTYCEEGKINDCVCDNTIIKTVNEETGDYYPAKKINESKLDKLINKHTKKRTNVGKYHCACGNSMANNIYRIKQHELSKKHQKYLSKKMETDK